jgi:hypothetical protein
MTKFVGCYNSGVTVLIPADLYEKVIGLYGQLDLKELGYIFQQVSRCRRKKVALLYHNRPDLNWPSSGSAESIPAYEVVPLFVPGACSGTIYDISMYAFHEDDVQRLLNG